MIRNRRCALRYLQLVRGVRIWLIEGVIPRQVLVDDLRKARAPVGFIDARLRQVGEPVLGFLRTYYVVGDAVGGSDGVLLAGARLTVPGGAGETRVDLLVPGLYRMSLSPGLDVVVDGAEVRSPLINLGGGPHRISWVGAPGTIQLVIASCAERRS